MTRAPGSKGPFSRTSTQVLAVQSTTSAQNVSAAHAWRPSVQRAGSTTRQDSGVAAVGLKRPHATLVEPQTAPRLILVAVRRQARGRAPLSSEVRTTPRAHFWKAARCAKLAHGH